MDNIKFIPNGFYDVIVFFIPTILLCVGIYIGIHGINIFDKLFVYSLGIKSYVFIFIVLIVLSYEFGRIAETWSAILVQYPLKLISLHTRFLKSPDFLSDHAYAYEQLGIQQTHDGRASDKWVVYFYAFSVNPAIGSDLLKRYAWEKLSRSVAFTYVTLLIINIFFLIVRLFSDSEFPPVAFGFGSKEYLFSVFMLCFITYYEYYKRNVWNYDLLMKTIPVLLEEHSLTKSNDHVLLVKFEGARNENK